MEYPKVKVLLDNSCEFIPKYETPGSSGMDIRACTQKDIILKPGKFKLIMTGLKFEIPPGYEIQIRPRSGLALRHGITVLNSPGTIDSDYRKDVGVILINHGSEDFVISHGMRIAQAVICPVVHAIFHLNEITDNTKRKGGFGSTGLD